MKETKNKKRVGVLRGGGGEHYTKSLARGGDIILHIHENLADKYKVADILIDKNDVWHMSGLPINPGDLVHKVDVVWNTAHPSFANILKSLAIPNISNNSFSHTLENSREMLREHVKKIGVEMPRQIVSPKTGREVLEKFPAPWKVGDKLVKTFPELMELIENEKNILVEEFIPGKVASVHSLSGFRKEGIYVFPVINVFGSLSVKEKETLASLAKILHEHLPATHYLKSDFVLNKRSKVYLLDLDSIPNLKSFSHLSEACEKVGAKMHQVVEHILEQV